MRDNSDREDGTAALDLDCVYGDGNEASPFLYHPDHHGFMLFGTKRLRNIGGDLGEAIKGFKNSMSNDPDEKKQNDDEQTLSDNEGVEVDNKDNDK